MLCFVGEEEREIERGAYPLAEWSPRPLDPPVTTATFPSREKIEPKLSSLT